MRNVRQKKYPPDKNLTGFFGRIHFYFPPISNINLKKKHKKIYIFSTDSPKQNFQSHILRGYLKNLT